MCKEKNRGQPVKGKQIPCTAIGTLTG